MYKCHIIQTIDTYVYEKVSCTNNSTTSSCSSQEFFAYRDGKLLNYVTWNCSGLLRMTFDYHCITVSPLPHVKLDVKQLQLNH